MSEENMGTCSVCGKRFMLGFLRDGVCTDIGNGDNCFLWSLKREFELDPTPERAANSMRAIEGLGERGHQSADHLLAFVLKTVAPLFDGAVEAYHQTPKWYD